MDTPLLVAVVGLAGALIGTLIGGLISWLSTKSVRRMEWKQSLVLRDLQAREELYADFLSEIGRLMLLSLAPPPSTVGSSQFSKLVALESKVWFHSDSLGNSARELAKVVLLEFQKKSETESEKDEVNTRFATLRDKFISECKQDLKRVRENA
jgi:hypothetical protein